MITITMSYNKFFAMLNDDTLMDIYTDLGAMGDEMDCEPEYWEALEREVMSRANLYM